jgi:hypothetical protein
MCDVMVITMFGDDGNVIDSICAGATGYSGLMLKDIAASILLVRAGGSPISPAIARRVLKAFACRTASCREKASAHRGRPALLRALGATRPGHGPRRSGSCHHPATVITHVNASAEARRSFQGEAVYKRTRWACFLAWAVFLGGACTSIHARPVRPLQADVIVSQDVQPPPPTAGWKQVDLPYSSGTSTAWYRVRFDAPVPLSDALWAVYLPYFNGGGGLILNGSPLARVQEPSPELVVRWERPHLIPIPAALLKPGTNELLIRAAATPVSSGRLLLAIGPLWSQAHMNDVCSGFVPCPSSRSSRASSSACWRCSSGALARGSAVWAVGAAALLWGIRVDLVIEVMPPPRARGEPSTALPAASPSSCCCSLCPGRHAPPPAAGPCSATGCWAVRLPCQRRQRAADQQARAGGLLPIAYGVDHQRHGRMAPAHAGPDPAGRVLALAVFAGLRLPDALRRCQLSRWLRVAAHRIFLLNYAADVLLLAMGVILSVRLVAALQAIKQLNERWNPRGGARAGARGKL